MLDIEIMPFFDISPSPDNLLKAFEIVPGDMISLVGGGGKTTLMYALAEQLSEGGAEVITTTTTKILTPKKGETSYLLVISEDRFNEKYGADLLRAYRHITIVSERLPDDKLKGISPEFAMVLTRIFPRAYIIIEADGSAQRPLKAPRDHEPVIPEATTLIIAVAGLDGYGRPLSEKIVFSVPCFAAITGIFAGETITSKAIADVITHPEGLTKGGPRKARIVVFLNKVDVKGGQKAGEEIAQEIFKTKDPRIDRVILGGLRDRPPFLRMLTLS